MPSKLKKAIAAVKDQTSISIAKVSSNTCSTLEVAVLKATTHDDVPVDERYIHEVVQLVSSNKSYAAACARAIGKRIGRTRNWIVALKSLMLVLRTFQDGDPYFPREVLHAMKKGAKILNLSNFRDDSNSSPWDFTAFIRTFALYLDERLDCFLTGKLQRRYNYKEKENSRLFRTSSGSSSSSIRRRTNEAIREMKPAMLLDKISYWQRLLERAIAIRPTGAAKTNCLVQVALYAVVQESFDLYKDVSDGLALVLDSFFHLPYQLCVNAFQTCVKAAKQFEEINSFYSFCKSIGVGRTLEYPSVQTISEELIESLQEFLKDQSSFPVKSSGQLLLQKPGSMKSLRSRDDSYGGESELSVATTEPYSERSTTTTTSGIGSPCSSLEELIRATETGRKNPSISIDLEAYSDIQFRKQCSEDVCDTGSARSLPVSMIDLVSSSNCPGDDEDENNEVKRQNQQLVAGKERDSSSEKRQEVVLNEALKPSPSPSFGAFSGQQEPKQVPGNEANVSSVEATSNNGWDLGLFESAPQAKSEQPMPSSTNANKVNGFNTSAFPSPSFGAFSEQEPKQVSRNEANASSVEASSNNGWDLGLFESTPQAKSEQPMPSSTNANKVNGFNTSAFPSPSFGAFSEQEPKQVSRNEANASSVEATSNNGSDLGLFEATPQIKSEQPMPNTTANKVDSFNALPLPSFNAFPEKQEQEQVSRIRANVSSNEVSSRNNGWDLALFEAAPQTKASQTLPITSNNLNSFNSSTLDELYSQSSVSLFPNSGLSSLQMPNTNGHSYDQNPSTTFSPASNNTYNRIPVMAQANHYNPFLQDTSTELPSNMFSTTAAPTFQATPTFSARSSFSAVQSDVNSDPFGTFSSSQQTLNGAINQQNLLHEQQLWLQNQNKIIAKHMS